MSRFNVINETQGEAFHNKPLDPGDAYRIARVMTYIQTHFINRKEWLDVVVQKGSLTLQREDEHQRVIKVFIDYGAVLWNKLRFFDPPPAPDPVVVGFELVTVEPYERKALRDTLARDFRYYVDPRNPPFSKWWLQPVKDHMYDLVVLVPGKDCEDVDEEEVERLAQRIRKELPVAKDED